MAAGAGLCPAGRYCARLKRGHLGRLLKPLRHATALKEGAHGGTRGSLVAKPGVPPGARSRTISVVDEWLRRARDAVAEAAGIDASSLELDDESVQSLLDVARIAAHESGERTNAPLLCYLLGRAEGRAGLDELAAAVRRAG